MQFVKILVQDRDGKFLEHFYIRKSKWGFPAGRVEKNESLAFAAKRELLERTGYFVKETDLFYLGKNRDFHLFYTEKKQLRKSMQPSKLGNEETKLRWNR